MSHKKTVVIALGGNALLRQGEPLSQAVQQKNVKLAVQSIAQVARENEWNIIITHGNGPQVGFLALQQEAFALDVLTAETQGIALLLPGLLPRQISVILTQVEVDSADPAFKNPTKPVGPFYDKYDEALAPLIKVGDKYRKVVASPLPKRIVELATIRALVELGNVVICCGGGGIPVTRKEGELHGVPAVIDKDRTSALLAKSLKVDALVMLTDVNGLYRNFGKPDQQLVSELHTDNLDKEWIATLPPGSIGPKVASGIEFANANPGGWAAIGSLDQLKDILKGTSGTRIKSAEVPETTEASTSFEAHNTRVSIIRDTSAPMASRMRAYKEEVDTLFSYLQQ